MYKHILGCEYLHRLVKRAPHAPFTAGEIEAQRGSDTHPHRKMEVDHPYLFLTHPVSHGHLTPGPGTHRGQCLATTPLWPLTSALGNRRCYGFPTSCMSPAQGAGETLSADRISAVGSLAVLPPPAEAMPVPQPQSTLWTATEATDYALV